MICRFVIVWWLMSCVALAQDIPPMPYKIITITAKNTTEIPKGGKRQMVLSKMTAAAVVVPSVPFNFKLMWDCERELPSSGVWFEIQTTQDLEIWTIIGETQKPPYPVTSYTRFGFYRLKVKYHNP